MRSLSRSGAFAGVWLGAGLVMASGAGAFSAACSKFAEFAQPAEGAPKKEFANAGELLAALETADQGLRRLTAGVEYTKIYYPDGDVQVRRGDLYFASEPVPSAPAGAPPHRRFAVEFTQFYRSDRLEDDPQTYAFDGQWLMEKHPSEKSFHLRQVVGPGETFDPLKVGQGPFPLPIGQKKDDILAQYDAALLEPSDGLALEDADAAAEADRKQAEVLISFVADCWQIRLTPKAGQGKAPEFSEVRLWYMKDASGRLLPRMARTVAATDGPEVKGDVGLVRLINVTVNDHAKFEDGVFDVRRPDGWTGTVDELPKGEGIEAPRTPK